jgi:hypothetical protein
LDHRGRRVLHVIAFLGLWHNRNKQARRLEAHLRNIVGSFSTHMDVDPYSTLDEKIDGFIHDIREILRDPARREDQRKLYHRLVMKEESKKYLQGKTFETVYNVLQTFIETYPFWGILGTLLGIGLGSPPRRCSRRRVVADREKLRRRDLVHRGRAGLRDRADAAALGDGAGLEAAGGAPRGGARRDPLGQDELGVSIAEPAARPAKECPPPPARRLKRHPWTPAPDADSRSNWPPCSIFSSSSCTRSTSTSRTSPAGRSRRRRARATRRSSTRSEAAKLRTDALQQLST